MPIYEDVWDSNHYMSSTHLNLRDLIKNHLGKLSLLKFDFVEYKANQQLACHVYERMMTHCFNQFGMIDALKRPECIDATKFFDECLQNHTYFARLKKYRPETLASSPYSRYRPHLEELGI